MNRSPSSQMSSYIAMNNKEVDYGMVKAIVAPEAR